MKANEMPEKIYLFDYNDAMVTPLEGDTVYVREDAFIKKACEWFRRIDYDDSLPPFETTEEFIEGFKKAMKGE